VRRPPRCIPATDRSLICSFSPAALASIESIASVVEPEHAKHAAERRPAQEDDYGQQWRCVASPARAAPPPPRARRPAPTTTAAVVQLERPPAEELTGLLGCCADCGWRNGWLPCPCPWHTPISLATEHVLPVLPQVAVCGGGGGGRAACAPRPGWRGYALNALPWLLGLALDPTPHRAVHRTSWPETVYRCRCVVYDDMGAPQVAELLRLLLTIAACCWIARVRTSYIDKHFGKHFDKRGSGGAAAGT